MLIRLDQPTNDSLAIIDIILLSMDGLPGEREFLYNVIMEFDAPVAIERDSINLTLTASPNKPSSKRKKPNFSAKSFRTQTAVAESSVRTAGLVQQSTAIATQTAEITKVIPNSSVSSFSKPTQSVIPTTAQSAVASVAAAAKSSSSKSSLPSVTPATISTTPRSLRTPKSSTPTQTRVIETSSPAMPSTGLLASSKTPSKAIAALASSALSKSRSRAGLSTVEASIAEKGQRIRPRGDQIRELGAKMLAAARDPASTKAMAEKLLGSNTTNEVISKLIYTPPSIEEVVERYVVETEIIKLKQKIIIREDRLGTASRFYITAELMTPEERTTAQSTKEVSHARMVNRLLTPTEPPTLSASFIRQGQISIGSQQTDPQATKLRLQRRNGPSSTCRDDDGSPWETVFEEALDINDGEIRYIDRVTASGYTLMYRAVAIGSNGKSTERFTTAVVATPKNQRQTRGRELNSVIKLNELSTQAKIGVTDLPENTVSVAVRKYDLGSRDRLDAKRGLSRGFTYVGDTPDAVTVLVDAKTRKVTFTDSSLKPGERYSYVPVAFSKRGGTIIGSSVSIEIPADAGDDTRVQSTIADLDVQATDAKGNPIKNPTISFTIDGSLTDYGFEQVTDAIGSSVSSGLFGGETQANREKFSSLVQFEVVRQNQTTGQEESFGIYSPGPFSDSSTVRESKGISEPAAGHSYVYKVTACIRSPETLFAELVTAEVDTTTLQRYTKSVSKFRGPMQLRKSTLSSTARQSDSAIVSAIEDTNPFLAGKTKDEQSIEVSIPKSSPRVSTVKSSQESKKNILTWAVEGEKSKIDHFKVYVTRNGGRKLLETIHADFSTPDFEFTHELEAALTRECQYEVVPVDLNFAELGSTKSDTVSPKQSSLISKRVARKSTIRPSSSETKKPTSLERDELMEEAYGRKSSRSTSSTSTTSRRSKQSITKGRE